VPAGIFEIANPPFAFVLVNLTRTESDFRKSVTTAFERFFFSTVSVTVPLIDVVCECEVRVIAKMKTKPAMNFLMAKG
jgi:hypothetical protein